MIIEPSPFLQKIAEDQVKKVTHDELELGGDKPKLGDTAWTPPKVEPGAKKPAVAQEPSRTEKIVQGNSQSAAVKAANKMPPQKSLSDKLKLRNSNLAELSR